MNAPRKELGKSNVTDFLKLHLSGISHIRALCKNLSHSIFPIFCQTVLLVAPAILGCWRALRNASVMVIQRRVCSRPLCMFPSQIQLITRVCLHVQDACDIYNAGAVTNVRNSRRNLVFQSSTYPTFDRMKLNLLAVTCISMYIKDL
jgi:hypothetical protein